MYSRKELLKPCEAFFSFDLDQGIFMALPRFVPTSRNQSGICRNIFLP